MNDDNDTNSDAATEARLVAEIVTRMVEWAEMTSVIRVDRWLTEVLRLRNRCGIRGVMVYFEAQCGDSSRLAASYADQVDGSLISRGANNRQAVHKARSEALAQIHSVNPELSSMLRELVNHRCTSHVHTLEPYTGNPASKSCGTLGSSPS